VIFVLLIACANVASLLLVRNSARQEGAGDSRAMGAANGRLLRQLLTESMLLALMGGLAGLLLAYGAVHALVAIGPEAFARLEEIRLDGARWRSHCLFRFRRVCCAADSGGSTTAGRRPKSSRRKAGAGRQSRRIRAQQFLVASEIALSMLLLAAPDCSCEVTCACKASIRLPPERVLSLQMIAPASKYPQAVQIAEFFPAGHRTDRAIPGVKAVRDQRAPATALTANFALVIEDRPDTLVKPQTVVGLYGVTPGYFFRHGNPLERGRFISDSDKRGAS